MLIPFMLIKTIVSLFSPNFRPPDFALLESSWIITEELIDVQVGNMKRRLISSTSLICIFSVPTFLLGPESMNSEPPTIPQSPIFPSWLAEAIFFTKLSVPGEGKIIVFILFRFGFPIFMLWTMLWLLMMPTIPPAINGREQEKEGENKEYVFHAS